MKHNDYASQLLDQSIALFWVVDRDYLLVYANKSYQNLMLQGTGGLKEINKTVFTEEFGEGYTEKWKAFYDRAFQGEHFEIEEHFYHPETKLIQYGQNTFEPLYNEDNKVYAVACQWRDITRIVKQRLEANQMIDASLDLFCTINDEGNFVYISAAAIDLWGYSPKELINTPFLNLIVEEDVAKTNTITNAIFGGEEIKSFENRSRKKNGEIAFNLWSTNWNSETNLIYCVARDGQEKNEKDKIIHLSEQRFKALVQEGSYMVTILDKNGNYKFVSPTNQIVLGISPEEYVGKNAFQFIHPDDKERTLESLKKTASTKRVSLAPYRFLNYNQEWRWIETVLTNMLDNPAINGIVSNSRDITDKIKQEEIIQQSEQRFKALVQDGSDMISIVDEDGKYTYTSPTTTTILGITPEEFQNKTIFDFIHPDDAESCLACMQKIRTEKRVVVPPFRLKDGQQQWRWIETVLTNMFDNPAVQGLVANSRDITKTIENLNKIEASEQFNRTVLESSPDCLKILDIKGRIQYMNYNGLCQMEIDDFSTIKNKNWWTLWGAENESKVKKSLDKALSGKVAQFTAYCPTDKGTAKWWDVLVSPVGKVGEPIEQILSVSRDITKQKEEEQRLKLLTSVITNTNDAVLITEAEPFDYPGPKIIYVNDAFTRMTGYTAEEVLGKTPRILQGPNSNSEDLKKLSTALRSWQPYEITVINYKKNGEEFWCNFSVTPVADKKGKYTHWIAIERDVTEQKNKEREKELTTQITNGFNQENDFVLATKELCKTVKDFGKFTVVEVWVPNFEKAKIQLISHCSKNVAIENFYDKTYAQTILNIGEGLAGKVLQTATILQWDNALMQQEFLRKDAADEIGLQSVIGIPLLFKNEVIGVLQIGSQQGYAHLEKYSKLFSKLEKFIGAEFYRKKLENDLAHLLDSVPDLICILDFEGKFLNINKAGSNLLGYNEAEILYQSFDRFLHPADKNYSFSTTLDSKAGGSTSTFENRFYNKEGEAIWLQWNCNTVVEEGYIYATAKNITVEKKLRELNQQSRLLTKMGSWEVDIIKQALFWSDEVHQMHETDPKSFAPNLETAINFYREDYRQIVQSSVEDCIATGNPFDFEAVLITTTKKELWVRVIGNPEFVDGSCIRLYGSFQDISAVKETENRLLATSENLPGVVYQYLIAADGTDCLKYVSKGVEKIWGFTAEQVIEDSNLVRNQIKLGGDLEKFEETVALSIKNRSKWSTTLKYVMPTGEMKTHIAHGVPTFLTDGSIIYNSIVLDITQEAKNEELLKQTSEIARLGSWEMDLLNQTDDSMYWSSVIWDILEVDDDYNPSVTGLIEVHIGESKKRIELLLHNLIQDGIEFEEELLVRTGKGKERWIKTSGKSEIINGVGIKIYGSCQDIDERKKAELKLMESEQEYRALAFQLQLQQTHLANAQKVAKIGSWETNLKDFTVSWSDETYRIFDVAFDKNMTHEKFLNNVHPLDREKVNKALGNSLSDKTKNRHFIEHRILTKTGLEKIVEERWEVDFDDNGTPIVAIGSCQDITERKKVEAEIIDSEEKRRLIMSGALDAIICIDTNENITFWNPQAEAIFGWKEEEIMGQPLSELIIPEPFRKFHKQGLEHYLKTGEAKALNVLLELTALRGSGEEFPIELTILPIQQGSDLFFCAFIRDISQRKRADLKLLKANERFEKVTEATNDAIWDWDIVNNSFFRSKAIERFFGGTTLQTLVGTDLWRAKFHEDDLTEIQDSVNRALASPTVNRWEFEYRIYNDKREIIYIIDRGLIIRDEAGKPIRMVGAMTNISHQKQLTLQLSELNQSLKLHAQELERSNQELEQFAFVASHDLQEPLRMISSFMDLLKRKYGDVLDEKALRYIYFATDGATRMKKIILDLLDYSRAGKSTEDKISIDTNEIITGYKLLRKNSIKNKSAKINSDNLPILLSYEAAVTQIFHCLIDNAIKYSVQDVAPIIHVSVIEKEKEWEFSIADNGIGIDSKFFSKIFIIFQRLHNSEDYEGTGIGLSIVKRQVEFLGGTIWLESKLGEGSTFIFTIPKN